MKEANKMTECKYDVWTRPSVELSDDYDAVMKMTKLEGMVFANPAAVGDTVCVLLDESYGKAGPKLRPDAQLTLGVVERIQQFPAFNGRNATTRLVLERRIADEERFQRFVETYGSRRQI